MMDDGCKPISILWYNGKWIRGSNLINYFPSDYFDVQRVIAAVGSGGKTMTLLRLGRELAQRGKKVIVFTTTHMMREYEYAMDPSSKDELRELLQTRHLIQLGTTSYDGRIAYMGDELLEWALVAADVLLYEADGSKCLPLKVPDTHEPVLLKNTDQVLILNGLSALDRPLTQVCHRLEIALGFLRKAGLDSKKVTEEGMALLMMKGYLEPLSRDFFQDQLLPIFNQADGMAEVRRGKELFQHMEWPRAVILSLKQERMRHPNQD